jgi:phage terminase large subunit
MAFELTAKQALAYLYLTDNKTAEIGFGGGAGGGKSYLGCFWILKQAIDYPGTSWLIGRRELTNLKKTTLLSLFKLMNDMGINSEKIMSINQQTNTIQLFNKSMIFLMDTAKNPSDPLYTRFGGLELTGAFIDESNETEEPAIEIIKTRIGRMRNKEYKLIPKLLETFNPAKNHVYYRYYMPYRDKELPDHKTFIKSLVTDNPYQDPAYIEQLKKAEKVTRERLLYGNFEYDDDPTKLFEYDAIVDLFTNEAQRGEKYCTVDVAGRGRDRTVLMNWDGLFVTKIKTMNNISTQELDEYLKKHQIPRSRCLIDEDGVGFGLVKDTPGVKGFVNNSRPIQKKKESEKEQTLHNYANLKAQCWFLLANYVNSGLIGIYNSVDVQDKKMLIEDLEQIKEKDPGRDRPLRVLTKEDIKEILGRSTDLGDTFMMRMFFEIKKPMGIGFLNLGKSQPTDKEEIKKQELEREDKIKKLVQEKVIGFGPSSRKQ